MPTPRRLPRFGGSRRLCRAIRPARGAHEEATRGADTTGCNKAWGISSIPLPEARVGSSGESLGVPMHSRRTTGGSAESDDSQCGIDIFAGFGLAGHRSAEHEFGRACREAAVRRTPRILAPATATLGSRRFFQSGIARQFVRFRYARRARAAARSVFERSSSSARVCERRHRDATLPKAGRLSPRIRRPKPSESMRVISRRSRLPSTAI